jgi:hypothetical protein
MERLNKEIGGYFGWSPVEEDRINDLDSYILLNSCRNALVLALRSIGANIVQVPIYTCAVVNQALEQNGIKTIPYRIDSNLEIVQDSVGKEIPIIYTNYFGVRDHYIGSIHHDFGKLVIDNAQALYSTFYGKEIIAAYSPRKFFGLPDGGMLSGISDIKYAQGLEPDSSVGRTSHLNLRSKGKVSEGYSKFKVNDSSLEGEPVKRMATDTFQRLKRTPLENFQLSRVQNALYLHQHLSSSNKLSLTQSDLSIGPLAYPYWINNGKVLRERLIANSIFVPTFWGDVLSRCDKSSIEHDLVMNLLPLPIDQRYGEREMDCIIELILSNEESG